MNERAIFSIHINGTKDAVWRELTRTDAAQPAFYDTVLHLQELTPGSSYQMRDSSDRYVNSLGEILECDPPNRLSQTVRFTRWDEPPVILTYDIDDAPEGGVQLTLTVEKLLDNKTGKGLNGGGGGDWICATIKELVENGRPRFSTRVMYGVSRLLNPLMNPKRTRVEHWPFDTDDGGGPIRTQ